MEKSYIVARSALPAVLVKTAEAKTLLLSGKAESVNEALAVAGISRSAYYKYRDKIAPLAENAASRIVTLQATLEDSAGVLSGLLNMFADTGLNVLTINQTIPVNGFATVTVSVRTGSMTVGFEELIALAQSLQGVAKLIVLASEKI